MHALTLAIAKATSILWGAQDVKQSVALQAMQYMLWILVATKKNKKIIVYYV